MPKTPSKSVENPRRSRKFKTGNLEKKVIEINEYKSKGYVNVRFTMFFFMSWYFFVRGELYNEKIQNF